MYKRVFPWVCYEICMVTSIVTGMAQKSARIKIDIIKKLHFIPTSLQFLYRQGFVLN